jgi:hypothetical protein
LDVARQRPYGTPDQERITGGPNGRQHQSGRASDSVNHELILRQI